jgi:capsular exopolysaccharide synthesis family protein
MNNLERYLDQVIEQRPVVYEAPPESPEQPTTNFFESVRRRWYIIVVAVVLICGVGLPIVWLLVEPVYIVQGAVHVAPTRPGILSDEPQRGGVAAYGEFVNTQANILVSGPMLQRIADDLVGQNLSILSGSPQTRVEKVRAKLWRRQGNVDPQVVLKDAVAEQAITAGHLRGTELLAVTMKSYNPGEAKKVVDSFLRNYQAMYGSISSQTDNENLSLLERKYDELLGTIRTQHEDIRRDANEYGTTALDSRQDMEMRRMTQLMTELTRLEAQRISLEANIALLEQTEKASISPDQVVAARREHVNSDPMITELSESIVQMERDLLVAKQTLMPENPALKQRQAMLDTFKQTLEDRRTELEEEFDEGLDGRLKIAAGEKLAGARAQLQQIKVHEERLRQVLNEQDTTTRQIGRTNLDIQAKQFQLDLDQEIMAQVSRRIKSIEMERQRRPRITLALPAEVRSREDNRVKLATALVLGALCCGFGLALLRDKMDKTLQSPDDVTRYLDLPIIGTTTSSRMLKPAAFAEQIAGDYQTIRTNLGMLGNGGMPKKLTVSSAGMREGKTTFAVNLATSMAKSGKKVLLIDGDLRKPDIGYMLNIGNGAGGLQDVLLGEDPSGAISVQTGTGLHVLPANPRHLGDAYEMLTSATAAEQIERLAREYDHIIIDSPPALAFPDALVWAKLSDAVILISFAGQTKAPELKEAKERFARIKARVLGAVLSNVPLEQNLYRYGYSYRARGAQSARNARKSKKLMLPTHGEDGTAAKV